MRRGPSPISKRIRIINNKFRELWDKNLLLSEMQSGQGNSSAGDRVLVPAEKPDGDRHPEPVGGKRLYRQAAQSG